MKLKHFLCEDMRSLRGNEPPWTVGETRTLKGEISLCVRGYHGSLTWRDALTYTPGPVATIIDLQGDLQHGGDKIVGRTRTLLQATDVSRELRLFACRCAKRMLLRRREAGHEPDGQCWDAVKVAQQYAVGEVSGEELQAARNASYRAMLDAEGDTAYYVTHYTTIDEASDAAYYVARNVVTVAAREGEYQAADIATDDAGQHITRFMARRIAYQEAHRAERTWQSRVLARMISDAMRRAG